MESDLIGKTAIITGASSGIGAATARLLAGAGCRVVLTARSAQKPLSALSTCYKSVTPSHNLSCHDNPGGMITLMLQVRRREIDVAMFDHQKTTIRFHVEFSVNNTTA